MCKFVFGGFPGRGQLSLNPGGLSWQTGDRALNTHAKVTGHLMRTHTQDPVSRSTWFRIQFLFAPQASSLSFSISLPS